MSPATILAHINAQPFRPFSLETVGGKSIDVTDRADIFVYQRMLPIRIIAFNPARASCTSSPDLSLADATRQMIYKAASQVQKRLLHL